MTNNNINDGNDDHNTESHITIRKRKRQRQRQRQKQRRKRYYYNIIDDKRIATLILLWALTTTPPSSSSQSKSPSLSPLPLDDASSRYHPPLPSPSINDNNNESTNDDDDDESSEDGEHLMASPSESEMAAFVGIPTLSVEMTTTEERDEEERQREDEEDDERIPPHPVDEKCNDESSVETTTTTTDVTTAATTIKKDDDDDDDAKITATTTTSPQSKVQNDDFLLWCRETLGIESLVAIDYFDYDERESLPPPSSSSSSVDDEEEGSTEETTTEGRVVKVRGLAAVGYINVGDVLISVPRSSLIDTHIIPHNDPFFTSTLSSTPHLDIDDFTTLVLYLLRQRSLHDKNNGNSHVAPYLDVLQSAPTDTIPMLWTEDRLRGTYPDPDDGVRVATEDIINDVKELYDDVMPRLIRHAPEVFASPSSKTNGDDGEDDGWMYSLEKFKWAYAMVNSRHWHLRLGHDDDDGKEEEEEEETLFMVPLADLINFGPPCTKGRYNSQTRSFEIIATCPFVPHQEVTFWYTDHCRDIVLAHYGFTHPSIPPCHRHLTTLADWKASSREWQRKAERYETMLRETQETMARLEHVLTDCFSVKEEEEEEGDDGGYDGQYRGGGGTLRGDPTPVMQQRHQEEMQPPPQRHQEQMQPPPQQHLVDVRVRGRSAGGGGVRRPSLGRDKGNGGSGGGSLNDVGL